MAFSSQSINHTSNKAKLTISLILFKKNLQYYTDLIYNALNYCVKTKNRLVI